MKAKKINKGANKSDKGQLIKQMDEKYFISNGIKNITIHIGGTILRIIFFFPVNKVFI